MTIVLFSEEKISIICSQLKHRDIKGPDNIIDVIQC